MLFGVLDRYHAAGENLRREGGGAGAPPHPSSMSILTQPFVRGGRADLKIADIHLTKGGVAYARGRFLTCLNTRTEEGLQRQLSQAPKS